jgi:hypothetical protein
LPTIGLIGYRSSDSAVLGSHLRDLIAISINFIIPALPEIREKPRTKLIAYGVELSWTAPKNSLNEIILYNVTCFICSQSICNIPCENEAYDPSSNNLRQISVIVSNLIAGGNYVFRVYVSVKDAVPEGEWRYIETDRVQVTSGKEMYSLEIYSFLALFTIPLTYIAFQHAHCLQFERSCMV